MRLGDTPGQWVPFSASMVRVFRQGQSAVGKLYRSADGSTRNETGPAPGRVDSIGISNVPDRLYYIWRPEGGWESRPLDLPGGRYLQPPEGAPTGATPTSERLEGMVLIKMPTNHQGITHYLVAELGYFPPVKSIMPCNDGQGSGCGLWLSDIEIGEQPADLFRPPTGEAAAIRHLPGPAWGESKEASRACAPNAR
jgi:hypothetical protein